METPNAATKAQEQAHEFAGHSVEAAATVSDTAMEEARRVTGELSSQVDSLLTQARTQLGAEVDFQMSRIAKNLHLLSRELEHMSMASRDSGADSAAGVLVERFAAHGEEVASYLDQAGPDGLFNDTKELARRRPAAFLIGAGALGFVTTRLAKHGGPKQPESAPAGSASQRPSPDVASTSSAELASGEPLRREGS